MSSCTAAWSDDRAEWQGDSAHCGHDSRHGHEGVGPARDDQDFWWGLCVLARRLRGTPRSTDADHFWNLQADDEHDSMLTDPANHVLLETRFAPLSKTTYVMTFH